MDVVTVSRRNHANKKENKENAQPAFGSKPSIKKEKSSAPPFQLKSNKKEETLAKSVPLKAKEKKADTRSASGEALKKTVQRNGKGAAVTEVRKRQTHSQAFLSEQAVKHKKMVAEAPKPPAAVPSLKSAPGMYKGKIIQSKIGSIWKSSSSVGEADPKPSAPKTESQMAGNMTKMRSKSFADTLRNGSQKPAPIRSKSVSEKPTHVSKPSVSGRPPAGFSSARPPARTIPATLTSTSTRNTKVAPSKGIGNQMSKPKVSVTDRKVSKPPVSSTISQYRLNVESAEERRAKLANWLASKGKTFKRPAMTTAIQPKTKVSTKPASGPKPQTQSHVETQSVKQINPEPQHVQEAENLDSAAALCADTQRAEVTTHCQTPAIMNTTLDLLEDSDDLFEGQQDRVDDIVVNLCDALEAMETPSRCNDVLQVTDLCAEVKLESRNEEEDCEKEELKNEKTEDVEEQLKVVHVKDEEKENDKEEGEMDDAEEADSDEGVMETTPQREEASVVKYSVKTTPYLQSVKKTIEGEVSLGSSRRKSNIKDLKFLTPVRRSCRIERKSSRMPTMLVDHDPCVSSLAELVKLDDDPNAYIYRKNPALLEGLPDEPQA
ncbi:cytoskeleton-associated protein 2 isoform X2 [Cheilinus undulatus]|uniref:cytoskeleton-associated protein 2 isoform X2 n=1 Tax=Cheilinus undulatus TaxID=241271 RepID=UPI001BD2435E|nr:cytoskeleton-associated protein 2 isoform X2 [Cheilinus undulatus]